MPLAFSYIRWSSEKQSDGDSKRRQTDAAARYATQHSLTLSDITYLDAGISAFKGRNVSEGALGAFLEACDTNKIPKGSYLLIENFDRLSRLPVMSALSLFQSIVSRGITIVTLSDNQAYSTASLDSNWTQLIIALSVMSRAHEENRQKSTRVKAAWDSKRASGKILTAMCPSWLVLQNEQFVLVPEKVQVVRRIFELSKAGNGTPTIARILNKEQIEPLGARAKYWSAGLVSSIVKNRAVIGTLVSKKTTADPIENYYPSIVSHELFFEVQNSTSTRHFKGGIKGIGVANLFAGITYCECGARVRFVSAKKPHLYLQCLKSYSSEGCDAPRYPYVPLEEMLIEYFYSTRTKIVQEHSEPDPQVPMKAELASKRERLERLLDLAESGGSGSQGISARILKLESEIKTLEHQLSTFVPPPKVSTVFNETLKFLDKHQELKTAGTSEALTAHRLKLQSAVRSLITKLILRKTTYKEPTFEYREIVLYGAVVEPLIPNIQAAHQFMIDNPRLAKYSGLKQRIERVTDDGGIVQMLQLPIRGFQIGNVRGRSLGQ